MCNFLKISDKFILPVSLSEFFNSVPDVVTDYGILSDHLSWQTYNEVDNISFLRNWQLDSNKQFLMNQLKLLQMASIEKSGPLVQSFLDINFDHTELGAIRVTGPVTRHIDQNRHLAITIGISNGASYETFIGDENNKYTVLDGEVYISRVDMVHWVKPIGEISTRYTLSYSIH